MTRQGQARAFQNLYLSEQSGKSKRHCLPVGFVQQLRAGHRLRAVHQQVGPKHIVARVEFGELTPIRQLLCKNCRGGLRLTLV